MATKAPIPKATGKKKAAPAKPKTLREELIEAGKARDTSAPPPDPAVVLAEIQATLAKMDASMDQVGDAADEATVRLSVEMGATDAEIEALKAKQAARKAEKQAKRDGVLADARLRAAGIAPDSDSTANVGPAATAAAAAVPRKGYKSPQDEKTRSKALKDGAPPTPDSLMRCWHCFPDLPPATTCDWLGRGQPGEKDRPGQPVKRFIQPGPHRNFPSKMRSKIYLQPLGDVRGAPSATIFAELLQRWFLLEVVVCKPPSDEEVNALERDERGCGYGPQIETPSAHELLYKTMARDAFIVLGYTMEDICNTSSGFGFLFGEANLDRGVGLFSFARYADGVSRTSARFLRRCGMVLCHEATHCFGVRHCVYASCLMNGSNHLEEAESRPFDLCPVDLRKLQLTLDQAKVKGRDQPPIDLVARGRGLIEWFDKHGLAEDATFCRLVVGALTGEPEPEPAAAVAAAEAAASVEPAPLVRQKSVKQQLEGMELFKPLVTRQPSGVCAVCDDVLLPAVEEEASPRAPPALKQLPSHDKGLLAKAYG